MEIAEVVIFVTGTSVGGGKDSEIVAETVPLMGVSVIETLIGILMLMISETDEGVVMLSLTGVESVTGGNKVVRMSLILIIPLSDGVVGVGRLVSVPLTVGSGAKIVVTGSRIGSRSPEDVVTGSGVGMISSVVGSTGVGAMIVSVALAVGRAFSVVGSRIGRRVSRRPPSVVKGVGFGEGSTDVGAGSAVGTG